MPGPPAGPSPRITTTSPAWISCASTAAIASSSPSNTRAGPMCLRRSWPASLTTQPSGATLPRRIAKPPVGFSGSSSGRTTGCPAVSCASLGVLADRPAGDRRRVGVQQPGLEQALEHERHAAGLVQLGRDVLPAGLQVAQQRRALGDRVELVDLQRHAHFARDGQQMQHRRWSSRRWWRPPRSRSPAPAW